MIQDKPIFSFLLLLKSDLNAPQKSYNA